MQERLKYAYANIRRSLRKAAETRKKYYDLRVKSAVYAKGSWVRREARQVDVEILWTSPSGRQPLTGEHDSAVQHTSKAIHVACL